MKKQKITQQDYLKAHRKASREEEIARHGRPARFRAVHKSKKAYDRKREKAGLRNLPFSFHIKIYSHSSPPACLRFGGLVQHMQTDDGLTLYFSAASLNVLNISPVVMHLIFRFLCRIACFDLQTLQPPPFNKLPGHACQILLHSAHCTNIGFFYKYAILCGFMQIIILFIILWRRTVPACIPLEDLSGSRLRLPARLRVH